ncbi:Tat pathway signal sequence domain protein [Streptomyces sp. NPDC048182]|uniref:Tat pathway signal sequence domain protein n=1 Tax=Streptomyces sp. NPDC048182 TaxID=3365507 RepID=UPI0037183BE3
MRHVIERHLGKVIAGGSLAVVAGALVLGVTLSGQSEDGGRTASVGAAGRDAVAPDGKVEAAAVDGEHGVGSDPLTDAETARAEQIALRSNGLSASARDADGDRGPQRIATNLAEDPTGKGVRRAEIMYYDYKANVTITKTVDLKSGTVTATNTARRVQPPPSQDELTEAARVLIGDPLGAGLEQDYQKATGKALSGPEALELSGFVFRKETVERIPAKLDVCGEHRCLQVVAKVKNGGPWIDTRAFVVDLSARSVGRLG